MFLHRKGLSVVSVRCGLSLFKQTGPTRDLGAVQVLPYLSQNLRCADAYQVRRGKVCVQTYKEPCSPKLMLVTAFIVWQIQKAECLNLLHGPLLFLWSVLGAREGYFSKSLISPCWFPHLQKHTYWPEWVLLTVLIRNKWKHWCFWTESGQNI